MSIILKNGRGQLGSLLKNKISNYDCEQDIYVYHTWNIDDKSEKTQEREYQKFIKFVDNNKHRVVFISTKSEKQSWYVYYKQLAEAYLIQNCDDCLVLRFPTIVGSKGTLQLLKYKKIKPYGIMELISIDNVIEHIFDNLKYNKNSKILSFEGQKITAKLVCEILDI